MKCNCWTWQPSGIEHIQHIEQVDEYRKRDREIKSSSRAVHFDKHIEVPAAHHVSCLQLVNIVHMIYYRMTTDF